MNILVVDVEIKLDSKIYYIKIMKDIKNYIYESDEWNPSLSNHKNSYNSFIKWYDKQLSHMNKEELLDMLKMIITEIEDDSLDTIK